MESTHEKDRRAVIGYLNKCCQKIKDSKLRLSETNTATNLGLTLLQVQGILGELDIEGVVRYMPYDEEKHISVVEYLEYEPEKTPEDLAKEISSDEFSLIDAYMYKFSEGVEAQGEQYYLDIANRLKGLYDYSSEELADSYLCSCRYKRLLLSKLLEKDKFDRGEKEHYEKSLKELEFDRENYLVQKQELKEMALKRSKTPQN